MADVIRNNFTSGELDPSLHHRPELEQYSSGARLLRNFIVRPQGGITKRQGTRVMGTSPEIILPFIFSENENYIVGVTSSGQIQVSTIAGDPAEMQGIPGFRNVSGLTARDIDYAQNADILVMTCGRATPIYLKRIRLSPLTFEIEEAKFLPKNEPPTIVQATPTGSSTSDKDVTNSYVVTAVIDGEETFPSDPKVVNSKSLDSAYGIKLTWELPTPPVDGGSVSHYRIYKETPYTSGHYAWIGDSKTFTFIDFNLAGITSDTPPSDFFEPLNPRAVAFYQQRLVYGGDADNPLSVTATATGSFTDVTHRRPAGEADAFSLGISASKYDRVQHLESTDTLVILSAGGIWRTTEGQSEKFTVETATLRKISSFGADGVKPIHAGSSILYSQAGAPRIRDLFAPSNPNGENTDLTVLCPHLFRNKEIMQLAYSENPAPVLWAVVANRVPGANFLGDRELLAMTYDRDQGVNAWSRIDFSKGLLLGYRTFRTPLLGSEIARLDKYSIYLERQVRGIVVLPSPRGDRVVMSMSWRVLREQKTWFEGEAEPPFGSQVPGNPAISILEEFTPEGGVTLDFSTPLEGWPSRPNSATVGNDFWFEMYQRIVQEYIDHQPSGSSGEVIDFLRPEGVFVGISRDGVEVPWTKTEERSEGDTPFLIFGSDNPLLQASEYADGQGNKAIHFGPLSHIGMKFPARAELLPVVGPETPHRSLKSVNRVTLWVNETVGPLAAGQLKLNQHGTGVNEELRGWNPETGRDEVIIPGEDLWETTDRTVEDEYSGPKPVTGPLEVSVIGQWDVGGTVVLEHTGSRACEVLAVEFDVDA